MNEAEKPFACSEKDCTMTFTNEDHLNWHQKKHDMMLNLGQTKNNDVADQTPTPTRFIRNCEEVGLFQDLQNVNPFDEFFQKAVETAKNGGTLEVPETNSDDTLHTPHILPHIEENQNKINSTNVIVIDDDSDAEIDVKKRIKETLQHKEKQKATNAGGCSKITVVPINNLRTRKETICGRVTLDRTRENLRESNRAAQLRCRKRKQIRWLAMEEELEKLRAENKRLREENYNLKEEVLRLKGNVTDVSEAAQPIQGAIIGTLIPVTDSQTKTPNKGTKPTLPNILKKSTTTTSQTSSKKTPIPIVPSPLVLQILPAPFNLAIPVTNGTTCNNIKLERSPNSAKQLASPNATESTNIPGQKREKRKNIRKLVPKIIIEN
ncbi:hypothetical protein NQ318_018808 [Aromia moschata]|uniref:Cyclic AMP-dependent transcription factor ATF-2 n=1 Tax=Aromia moschata TaxID=1265417 RepID=A0AAV8ZIK0_9CUCU|nr:hypothetical protein NQ318_018808 [Aromia moschata]